MIKAILVDAWNTFVTGGGLFIEMKNILDKFEIKKIILTNANEEEKVKYGIVNMPYDVFTLAHEPNKTDPEYYKRMLEHFHLTSEEVIYFEHNAEAVKSALSVGIKTFHYNKYTKNIDAVKDFLKKNIE